MRRAFFFIVAIVFATTSYASIPRASMLDSASPIDTPSPETRIRVSDDLAPFDRPTPSLLSRALRQGYEQASTTEASGLRCFLSVDPARDWDFSQPQSLNLYQYARNNPLLVTDPTGRAAYVVVRENGKRRYALDSDEDGVADELEGVDSQNPCGIFGCSAFIDVQKIDRVMTATLGLMNSVGIALLETFSPGGVASSSKRRASRVGVRVSQRGLAIVERHLAQFGYIPENSAMLRRLKSALEKGERVIGADANFYLHELTEAGLMRRGMSQTAAHAAALERTGMSPYSIYHPDVIKAFPETFNNSWRAFWGLP